RDGQICPVLLGSALRSNGVLRLMKALRHEAPGVTDTARRLGLNGVAEAVAYVMKTIHLQHGGKLSLARVLTGQFNDGAPVVATGAGGGKLPGSAGGALGVSERRPSAAAGDVVALGKLDQIATGDVLTAGKTAPAVAIDVAPPPGVLAMAIAATERKDDVKLG